MERINKLVNDYLSPALKSLGFKKKNHKWKRERNQFVDVIEAVVLSGSTSDNERCNINYGVCVPKFHEVIWNDKLKTFPDEANGVYRSYLSGFISLDSDYDITNEGQILCEHVKNKIVPKLNSFSDYQKLHDYLESSNVMKKPTL